MSVGTATAAVVRFEFVFRDSLNSSIGTGFYQFDDISPATSASFSTLTSFSWEFDIPSLSIYLSSANGDTPSTDSLFDEGISLTGAPGSRDLKFFDDAATYILHEDNSEIFPSGIQFTKYTNELLYFDNGTSKGSGTFVATQVPEPSPCALAIFGLTGGLLARRRRARI